MQKQIYVFGILCVFMLSSAGRLAAQGPAGSFKTLPGFEVDLVYDVSKNDQGSWVSLCVDDKQRIIACDQYGKLYRITLHDQEDAAVGERGVVARGHEEVRPVAEHHHDDGRRALHERHPADLLAGLKHPLDLGLDELVSFGHRREHTFEARFSPRRSSLS